MANYYTHYAVGIAAAPDEAKAILRAFAYIEDPDNNPEPSAPLLELIRVEEPCNVPDIEYEDGVLYISDDAGCGEPWFLAQVLATVMPTAAIDIPYANTCDKARLDSFSGGTWHVRYGEVFNAEDVLRDLLKILRDARDDDNVDCTTVAGAYLLGDVMGDALQKAESIL